MVSTKVERKYFQKRQEMTLLAEEKPRLWRTARAFREVTSDASQIAIVRQDTLFAIPLLAALRLFIMSLQTGSYSFQWICKVANPRKLQAASDDPRHKDSFNDCLGDGSQCQTGHTS